MEEWKKEAARDLVALGSIPFYFLVMARSLVGNHYLFLFQTLIALGILHAIGIKLDFNRHLSRILILVVFTIIFYHQLVFSKFAIIVGFLMLGSLFYLKESFKKIGLGLIIGILASFGSYFLAGLI